MTASGITRREMLRRGGGLAVPALLGTPAGAVTFASGAPPAAPAKAAAAAGPGLRLGSDIYESIGVRPFVNARGTYTILTGSTMLPEVRAAMEAASRHYVHLDELAEAIGARLAELTGAEWGMVTIGCSAALTHATAACVTGGNPDLHVRIPDLRGFPRDECIIPKHSRNVYDAARARRRACASIEVDDGRRAGGGLRPAHGARLHPGRARTRTAGPLSTKALCDGGEAARRARARGRRGRDPDRAQRAPAARRRPSSPTAAASACAARRPRACSSAARTS